MRARTETPRRGPVGESTTHTRRETPPGYKFPPLMEDKRENNFVRVPGKQIDTYVTPVGGPYTGEKGVHLMVIPDSHPDASGARTRIPDVMGLDVPSLNTVLRTAADTATAILNEAPNVDHVDVGYQYSTPDTNDPTKLKQKLNTVPDFHVHVTGYERDAITPLDWGEIENDVDLFGRTGDRLHGITSEILQHEIIEGTLGRDEEYNALFEPMRDERDRLRFKLTEGVESFSNPKLAETVQTLHTRAQEEYDKLGKCFFAYDKNTDQFIESDDDYGRYKLLPPADRQAKLNDYLEERSWLSEDAQFELRRLGENAQTATESLARGREKYPDGIEGKTDYRSDQLDKIIANTFWAHKGLGYATVFSADRNGEWTFGFDLKTFTVEGVPQSSPHDTIITKQEGAFSEEALAGIQEREAAVVDGLLANGTVYQRGTKSPYKV